MEVETPIESLEGQHKPSITSRLGLLLPSCICFAVSTIGGRILLGMYYRHGGSHKWFSCWVQNIGFPLLALPLSFLFKRQVSQGQVKNLREALMEPKLFVSSASLGLLAGLIGYMYAWGMSSLPVSTASLLTSTQLAFTAFFSFIFVKQKLTFYSINAVALMILGAIVLVLHSSGNGGGGDRPEGVSRGKYLCGFLMALGVAALGGLSTPLVELSYLKSRNQPISYAVVMQFQFVMNAFSAMFCTCGVVASKDLSGIRKEAREYELGEVKYYMVVAMYAALAQFYSIGFMGILYCTSSLFLGIFTVILLPLTQIIAAIVFHEKYTAEKGMSLALCLWGFTSYFVGVHTRRNCSTGSLSTAVQADNHQVITNSQHDP